MTTNFNSNLVVGTVDVGAPKNIGWAIFDGASIISGSDLDEFISTFAIAARGRTSTVGFEAPLFIPRRSKLEKITTQRSGEFGKPWSAGAGATVTTIGLAVVDYTLTGLKAAMPGREGTLDWENWDLRSDEVLFWEAFVTGTAHAGPGEHWKDALNAATAFLSSIHELSKINAITEYNVTSLIGLAMVRTGWAVPSVEILSSPCLVVRPAGQFESESY